MRDHEKIARDGEEGIALSTFLSNDMTIFKESSHAQIAYLCQIQHSSTLWITPRALKYRLRVKLNDVHSQNQYVHIMHARL